MVKNILTRSMRKLSTKQPSNQAINVSKSAAVGTCQTSIHLLVSILYVRHSFCSGRVQSCSTSRRGWSISLFPFNKVIDLNPVWSLRPVFHMLTFELFGTLSWRLRRPPTSDSTIRTSTINYVVINAHTTAVTDCLKVSTCIIRIHSKLVLSAGAGSNSNLFLGNF